MSKYQDLSVPFNIPIPGGMSPGKFVLVQGKVPSMSQRFAVNLLTRSGDIALHLSPKFKENRVVRNNVLNMNWGPDESHGSMPIHPGQSFEIYILCESYSFKIAFNGNHFCDFSHRLPFNTITNLAVDGEVVVHNVNFKDSSGYGNNNSISNSTPYGFAADRNSNYNSGGLYPSIDSYPYPSDSTSRRSPSPSVPPYSSGGVGFKSPSYPSPSGPSYPSSGGGGYPQNPSLYPTQPGYPSVPHQGPYPQIPNSGGVSPTPHNKPGFLDQAGAALAGVLGPGLLAGGMNRNSATGKPNLLDEAGRALAGVIGGTGLAGAGHTEKGTQPHSTHQSGFLDVAGSALAGILAGGGLAAADRSLGGRTQPSPVRHGQPGSIFDHAGSALAGILASGGLAGADRSIRGGMQPSSVRHGQPGSILDQAGSALAGILGGGGLTGTDRTARGGMQPSSVRHTPSGSIFDQAGSALAEILGGGGLSDSGHHNRNKLGVLGGALGTAVAGAALTGHLNPGVGCCGMTCTLPNPFPPNWSTNRNSFGSRAAWTIKAAKKQLKAQKKAQKKALKYGLPLAGAGLGAYALHKGLKKGFHRSSSSSSCSSSD